MQSPIISSIIIIIISRLEGGAVKDEELVAAEVITRAQETEGSVNEREITREIQSGVINVMDLIILHLIVSKKTN